MVVLVWYITLSFRTEKEVIKNLHQIISYFENRLTSYALLKGADERSNYGFNTQFKIKK